MKNKKQIQEVIDKIENMYSQREDYDEDAWVNKSRWARRIEMKLNLILDILKETNFP